MGGEYEDMGKCKVHFILRRKWAKRPSSLFSSHCFFFSSSKTAKHETASGRTSCQSAASTAAKCKAGGATTESAVQCLFHSTASGINRLFSLLLGGGWPFAIMFVGCCRVNDSLAEFFDHTCSTTAPGTSRLIWRHSGGSGCF